MKAVRELEDAELRTELAEFGCQVGPIAGTTRNFYEKKLEAFRSGNSSAKPVKGTAKKTPMKNNAAAQPTLMPTPLSAKKKSKRSQSQSSVSTESSDNELDLTIPDSSAPSLRSNRVVAGNSSGDKKKPGAQASAPIFADYSPPRAIVKRTPTPPRSSVVTKRTPLRESSDQPMTMRGNIFSGEDRSKKSIYNSYDQDDDEDDHMESSRIISPSKRFDPFRSSMAGAAKVPISSDAKEDSPIGKIKKFGQSAWGYFSRPVNTSTPCTDADYKTTPKSLYDVHTSKYGRYSQDSSKYSPNKYSATEAPSKKSLSPCDASGWMLTTLMVFVVLLAIAYVWTTNPKSIEHSYNALQDSIKYMVMFFYQYAILPVLTLAIVGTLGYGIVQFFRRRELNKEERKKKMIDLVERITDIIRDAQDEGIPEPHVRDLLMPPTKRSSEDWKLWSEAAEFINAEDSRVRTEVRLINGIECNVWVWVPITKTRQKWQGSAVAEGSPSSNVPSKALTRCIKLRGLNFSNRANEKIELRRDLRSKLGNIAPVHMEFVVTPFESVVYLMLRDLSDAKKAFSAFHSNWFNGSLLAAKYVPDCRYIERFPEAATC